MREIANKQENGIRSSKKRFAIFWTETVEYVAEVRAKTKGEARVLFHKDDIQILGGTECLDSRKNSSPSIMEVSE